MFEVEIILATRCAGKNPCKPKYDSAHDPFLKISLSGEEGSSLPEKPTLSDVIGRHLDHEDDLGPCERCGGKRTVREEIGSFPEILLVHLNRTDDSGKKIGTHVYLSEQLNIETRFIDERWGNERKVIQYKLSSVVMHLGDTVSTGHYTIGVKGKGDTWSRASDTLVVDWNPEEPGGHPCHLDTGYLFAYRRLPTDDPVVQTPGVDDMQVDSPGWNDGGAFADFDSSALLSAPDPGPLPSVPGSVTGPGANVWGNDPKALGKLLDVMIPKVIDGYIARTADSRRKEWENWADEWEKKRESITGAQASGTGSGIASGIGPAINPGVDLATDSATDPDIGTISDEVIVDWIKQRGRLEITLTGDGGKGSKLLDLEVQGLHYNRLKRKKGAKGREEDEEEDKDSSYNKFKRKLLGRRAVGKAKDLEKGDKGKAKGKPKGKGKGKKRS